MLRLCPSPSPARNCKRSSQSPSCVQCGPSACGEGPKVRSSYRMVVTVDELVKAAYRNDEAHIRRMIAVGAARAAYEASMT